MNPITNNNLRLILKGYVASFKSQSDAARSLQCDTAQLSKMLSGQRPVSAMTARKIGYRKIVLWEKI